MHDLQPDVGFFGNYNLVQGGEFIQHNVVVNGAKGVLKLAIFVFSQVTYNVAHRFRGIRTPARTSLHVRVSQFRRANRPPKVPSQYPRSHPPEDI